MYTREINLITHMTHCPPQFMSQPLAQAKIDDEYSREQKLYPANAELPQHAPNRPSVFFF
jgi:hypothetical protein